MRLLLPEDPGREQMVELVRLFDPDARPASAGRICVDVQRQIYLSRPTAVDPGAAAEAQAPPGLRVAYFVQLRGRSARLDMSGAQRERREMHQTAVLLINGLAGSPARRVRLPSAQGPGMSLQATVYTPRPVTAADVLGVVGQYVDGLTPVRMPGWHRRESRAGERLTGGSRPSCGPGEPPS